MIKITLPDGSVKEFESGVSVKEVTESISKGLERASVGAVFNGRIMGKQEPLKEDGDFKVVKFEDPEGKEIFWHSSAHLMAAAIQRLYPETKFAIGPAISNGFYYDIDLDQSLNEEDLLKIEEVMKKIVKENPSFERIEVSREEALKKFKEAGQDYKIELIEELDENETITIYQLGDFFDLCRGPHLEDVKKIKAFKLLSIAGAYWRGDEKNKMLQRIYGISFEKKKELDEYLHQLEEAQRRDHRKIGREQDLFSFHEEGPGFPFFHPNGMIVRNQLLDWWKGILNEEGYGEISTPVILNEDLWHRSGHWDHYKENMYFTKIDGDDFAIKPMNCPGSTIVYSSNPHSYRDLPIRLSEFGLVHRHELSGALHGLFRVRTFTQDDAHIYCLPSQVEEEVFALMELADRLYKTFGFEYSVELSTRPDDYMGSLEDWERAEGNLKSALEKVGLDYDINPGDGAFYGPKIDFKLKDAIGRTWQCGTIQLDFQMPINFDLTYVDSDGEKKRPVMLHRALLGSIERFLGILIEHFAGRFPLWLSPVQVSIIPVSDKYQEYAEKITEELKDAGIRVHLDNRREKVGYKIREAQIKQVNYMVVVGEKEVESEKVSVRTREGEELSPMSNDDFIAKLVEEIETKAMSK